MLNEAHDDEFLPGRLPGNRVGILADLLWAKPQTLDFNPFLLNAKTITSLFPASLNHVATIRCPHSGTKTRCSFSLTVGAAQGSLHNFVLS
jgi:hypothetical protein